MKKHVHVCLSKGKSLGEHLTETVQFISATHFNRYAPDIGKVQPEVPKGPVVSAG